MRLRIVRFSGVRQPNGNLTATGCLLRSVRLRLTEPYITSHIHHSPQRVVCQNTTFESAVNPPYPTHPTYPTMLSTPLTISPHFPQRTHLDDVTCQPPKMVPVTVQATNPTKPPATKELRGGRKKDLTFRKKNGTLALRHEQTLATANLLKCSRTLQACWKTPPKSGRRSFPTRFFPPRFLGQTARRMLENMLENSLPTKAKCQNVKYLEGRYI